MKLIKSLFLLASLLSACEIKGYKYKKTGFEGKKIPSFKVLLKDSVNVFSTNDIPLGKPFVLLFFSSHCRYSKAVIRSITENIEDFEGIQIYMFTSDSYQSMKKFSSEFKLDKYPNITLGMDRTYYTMRYFKLKGVPFIAIYNEDKTLYRAKSGASSSKNILWTIKHQ